MAIRKRPNRKEARAAIAGRLAVYQEKPPKRTALVGHSDGSTIDVPGKPDYVYVRIRGDDRAQVEVLNYHGALAYNMPVRMELTTTDSEKKVWAIVGLDRSFFTDTGGWGGAGNTGAHRLSHEWPDQAPGSDAINVYARAIAPLRGYSIAGEGLRIYVNSAILTEYVGNGAYVYTGGSILIESGDLPATAGQIRIVLISLDISDPDNPSLTKTLGDPILALETAEPEEPDFPADEIPVCAVLVRDDHAQLEEIDIYDRRQIITGNTKLSTLTSPDGTLEPLSVDNNGDVTIADGDLVLAATRTVDGVDISAHAADADAHHNRSHAMTDASDHSAGNWKLFHSNGSGAVAELALGAAGTVLRSNGAAAAPTFGTAGAISHMLALTGLRGLWPMSAIEATGSPHDLSGNGLTLQPNGDPRYSFDGLAPYADLDGAGDCLTRTDTALLDILGTESYMVNPGLTLGGWFWFDAGSTFITLIGKRNASADLSYYLQLTSGNLGRLAVSSGGTGATVVLVDSSGSVATDGWYFMVGRFNPSTELAIFVNGAKDTNTTSIPAAIYNGAAPLSIGATGAGISNFLDGRASLCFLCAATLSDAIIDNLFQQSRALFGV